MAEPALRFDLGTKVQCRTGKGDDDEAWSNGEVVKLWYREAGWPTGRTAPYQVKLDNGPLIYAPMDDDNVVREPTGLLKDGKIPVTCLTGFLGAGKTTLLNYILKTQHGKKYAVIENEVGAVGIDNQLLKAGGAQRTTESVTLLDNGCLCCTVRGDLVTAIRDIVDAAKAKEKKGKKGGGGKALDGILIETTGLADPGPICKTFYGDPFVSAFCKIDGVITVVDGVHFVTQLTRERTKDAVNESAQQVAFADKVLLNKIDVATPEQLEATMEAIRSVNPYVEVCRCTLGTAPDAVPLEEMLRTGGFDLTKLLEGGDIDLSMCAPVTGVEEEPSPGGHGDHGGGHGSHGDGHGGHGGDGHDPDCQEDHGDGGASHGGGHGHGHGHGHSTAFRHDLDVGSMVCEVIGKPLDFDKFREWMSDLLEAPENLYRYKGILAVRTIPGGPVMRRVVQGVHDMCQSEVGGEWPEGEPLKSQMVLIGRKLDRPGWTEKFANCAESESSVRSRQRRACRGCAVM